MDFGDPWLTAYDGCDRRGHDITELISQRNRQPRGSSMYSKASASIRTDMMKYSTELESLRDELIRSATQHRLTQREADRRQVMIDKLLSKKRQMEQTSRNEVNAGQRSDLMGPLADVESSWGATTGTLQEDTSNPFSSIDEVRQQQRQVIREQDEGLESLSSVLSRQKQMAVDIGNEVDGQNELIEDITDHVDSTHTRLIQETRHIRIVDKKSNTCVMWVVIILLFVTIVVICFIPKKVIHH